MANGRAHTWQDIHERIKRNIINLTWPPGELIPGEVELAQEYGCARTTVNRALRELAATGVVDRKRKAGTRVAKQKTRQVRAEIPVIRTQVEAQGAAYRFQLLENKIKQPSKAIAKTLNIKASEVALHIRSIHYADELPFIYEDRWINVKTIPKIKQVDLAQTSANEWLVQHVPFTSGEFVIQAQNTNKKLAMALGLSVDEAILTSTRTTWLESKSVTTVTLKYSPGYQMHFEI